MKAEPDRVGRVLGWMRTLSGMFAAGLVVLAQEDHTVPSVAFYTYHRVGSRNERPGITGLSLFGSIARGDSEPDPNEYSTRTRNRRPGRRDRADGCDEAPQRPRR